MCAILEIEVEGETSLAHLFSQDMRHVQRLAEAGQNGAGIPLSSSTAKRLIEAGLPLKRSGRRWSIHPSAVVRQMPCNRLHTSPDNEGGWMTLIEKGRSCEFDATPAQKERPKKHPEHGPSLSRSAHWDNCSHFRTGLVIVHFRGARIANVVLRALNFTEASQ